MENQYGSDFITIEDNDGVEYELEIVSTLEYNGASYLAAMPTSEELEPEILYFRVEEDAQGDLLAFIDDESELEAVETLFMEVFFAEDTAE
ncbi:MAG: DUF1292 domain-containing protein [Ruminococcaceae bacterium]|nr:DUF1292 domain-containing protein [Oscillospiraceae bacterium]